MRCAAPGLEAAGDLFSRLSECGCQFAGSFLARGGRGRARLDHDRADHRRKRCEGGEDVDGRSLEASINERIWKSQAPRRNVQLHRTPSMRPSQDCLFLWRQPQRVPPSPCLNCSSTRCPPLVGVSHQLGAGQRGLMGSGSSPSLATTAFASSARVSRLFTKPSLAGLQGFSSARAVTLSLNPALR